MSDEKIDVRRVMKDAYYSLSEESDRDDMGNACSAVAELIEADEKYDEARRLVYDLSRTGAVQCRADLDLFDKATARRAAALDRVRSS